MPITEAQARGALRHADIPWDAEVDDPCEGAWVVHDHLGILGAPGNAPRRAPRRSVADYREAVQGIA